MSRVGVSLKRETPTPTLGQNPDSEELPTLLKTLGFTTKMHIRCRLHNCSPHNSSVLLWKLSTQVMQNLFYNSSTQSVAEGGHDECRGGEKVTLSYTTIYYIVIARILDLLHFLVIRDY